MSEQTSKESKLFLNKNNISQIVPPLLGVDYGERNVGLAITDMKGIIASPLEIIRLKNGSLKVFNERFRKILEEYRIKTIILGLPQEFKNSHKKTTEKILNFQKHLQKLTEVPVFLYDESYSTQISYATMREQGQSQKKSRGKIDKIATACFLQELIDFKNKTHEK